MGPFPFQFNRLLHFTFRVLHFAVIRPLLNLQTQNATSNLDYIKTGGSHARRLISRGFHPRQNVKCKTLDVKCKSYFPSWRNPIMSAAALSEAEPVSRIFTTSSYAVSISVRYELSATSLLISVYKFAAVISD